MICGQIYKITNKINGKIYIGQTISKNPLTRWKDHLSVANHPLYKAMVLEGTHNFCFSVMETGISSSLTLNALEKNYICNNKSFDPKFGYNTSKGTVGVTDRQINGQIYCILNLRNNKIYIGQTSYPNYRRWNEHRKYASHPLYRAMIQEGIDNFSFAIIHNNIRTRTLLNKLETQLIFSSQSFLKNVGYNQDFGKSSYLVKTYHRQGFKAQ